MEMADERFIDFLRFRQARHLVAINRQVNGAALRGGNFQGTARLIHDPGTYNSQNNTRQLFPNMTIPSSLFDSASVNILKFIPGSNDPNLEPAAPTMADLSPSPGGRLAFPKSRVVRTFETSNVRTFSCTQLYFQQPPLRSEKPAGPFTITS